MLWFCQGIRKSVPKWLTREKQQAHGRLPPRACSFPGPVFRQGWRGSPGEVAEWFKAPDLGSGGESVKGRPRRFESCSLRTTRLGFRPGAFPFFRDLIVWLAREAPPRIVCSLILACPGQSCTVLDFPGPCYHGLPMPRKDGQKYLTEIPLSDADYAAFQRLRASLENLSVAKLGQILLHYAIWHPTEAFGERFAEALQSADNDAL
jgi:hypothetical protein